MSTGIKIGKYTTKFKLNIKNIIHFLSAQKSE